MSESLSESKSCRIEGIIRKLLMLKNNMNVFRDQSGLICVPEGSVIHDAQAMKIMTGCTVFFGITLCVSGARN